MRVRKGERRKEKETIIKDRDEGRVREQRRRVRGGEERRIERRRDERGRDIYNVYNEREGERKEREKRQR